MKRESKLGKRKEINIFIYLWRSGHVKSYAVMVRGFVLISSVIAATIFNAAHSFSADYNNELLFEVLVNARLREKPSLSAEITAIIPGGFVVSVVREINDGEDWYAIIGASGDYPNGYINRSLLKPYNVSYELQELKNSYHKIKYFRPGESSSMYIYPQHHARIYSKTGQFLSHLPRLLDCEIGGVNIIPGGFDSGQPFYTLKYSTGGAHCCYKYTYISKSPLFQNEFTIDAEHSDIMPEIYDATGNRDYRIKVYDWSYAYWLYSFGGSPAPEVILKIVNGELSVSQVEMIKPKPSIKELSDLTESKYSIKYTHTRNDKADFFSYLTGRMLDLVYSGNFESAIDYLYMVWPEDVKFKYFDEIFDRDVYKEKLWGVVREAQYYQKWMLKGVQ
jgi:hypothetical protein